jgi:hypothetical protein
VTKAFSDENGTTITINGYAYETIPNKAITTGVTQGNVQEEGAIDPVSFQEPQPRMPASLGMLAFGASGLDIWRRQEEEPAQVA